MSVIGAACVTVGYVNPVIVNSVRDIAVCSDCCTSENTFCLRV